MTTKTTTITTRTDLHTYLADVRADLTALGSEYVDAVLDQIAHSDHPAWGEDWSAWLSDELDGLITATVDGIDAIADDATIDAAQKAHADKCDADHFAAVAREATEPQYRLVYGERGNEQGHVDVLPMGTTEDHARGSLSDQVSKYCGDGWGRVEVKRPGGWERID